MLTKEQIERFQKRFERATSENESWIELNTSGTLMLDGNFSSAELKEISEIMAQVEATNLRPIHEESP